VGAPPGSASNAAPPLPPEVEEGCRQALRVLEASVTAQGLVASAALPHYAAIWTRDVAFAALGVNVVPSQALAEAVASSLRHLARCQATSGQVPVAFWPDLGHWDFHESGCTDATCLFVVAAVQHLAAHADAPLQRLLLPHLERAMAWLADQDANQFTLIDSPSGGDWMDSTLQRSGKLLYVNVLYHRALRGMAQLEPASRGRWEGHAARLRRKLELMLWPEPGSEHADLLEGVGFPEGTAHAFPHPIGPAARRAVTRTERTHYLSHVDGGRYVDECDVLGNVLAVLYGVAPPPRARRIMEFLHTSPAAQPFPMRTYTRSFAMDERWGMYRWDLEELQDPRWRNPPGRYHNGGVWPFIGGLYVSALQQVGMTAEAKVEMSRLAAANRLSADPARQWGFHEWIDATTGEPGGAPDQSWSAGTYLLAAETLRGGKISL
jgi:glycogen debranching enzyme